MTKEEEAALRQERSELLEGMQGLLGRLNKLAEILAPIIEIEKAAKSEIASTYVGNVYDISQRVARKRSFDRLLDIAVKWGKTRNERKEMARQYGAFKRRIEVIDTALRKASP
jgi:hypothetical protein